MDTMGGGNGDQDDTFGMACRTTKPMASTTSTKARNLRCVPRRDGVSIGSSVAKPSRGWSVESATSGQDAMARDAAQPRIVEKSRRLMSSTSPTVEVVHNS